MQEDGGAWSAYLVGALIGVLSMASFVAALAAVLFAIERLGG